MKNISLILILFCVFFKTNTKAQNLIQLSENTKIALVTVAAGLEVNDTFGHTLLWINDPDHRIDLAYNWGVYDFDTEGFYIKFIKGQLPYSLAVGEMYQYSGYYQEAQRNMSVQEFDLPLAEKQKIYELVENNYLPQNRLYFYKFYTDNCATRVLNILQKACGKDFKLSNNPELSDSTYRYWMNKNLQTHQWARLGMNLTLGLFADNKISESGACYIPKNLSKALECATFKNKKIFNKPTYNLFEVPNPAQSQSIPWYLHPLLILSILFLVGLFISIYESKNKKHLLWFDKIIFSIAGIIGWFLFALWFFTDHFTAKNNLNLLWALPFHLPIIWLISKNKLNSFYKNYFILVSILLTISLWIVFQQNKDLLPFVALLLMRAFLLFKKKTVA